MLLTIRRILLAVSLLCVVPTVFAAPQSGDLIKAVSKGDDAAVKALLAEGAPVDERGSKGATALMYAAELGKTEIVRALIAAGADARATREGNITALHHAASAGNPEVIALLIAAKADVNAITTFGNAPVHSALLGKKWANARALLAAGAKLDAAPVSGAEALLKALDASYIGSSLGETDVAAIDLDLVKQLLAAGAKLDAKNKAGYTALHLAAAARQPQLVAFFLDHGLKVNEATADGVTPIQLAAKTASLENLLTGLTVIIGIMPNVAPGVSAEYDMRAIRKRVMTNGFPSPTPGVGKMDYRLADIARRRSATLALLLKAGADANAADKDGNTLLMDVAYLGDTASVETLLLAGAKPDVVRPGGYSALMRAATEGRAETVKSLLAHGASVDLRNEKGETALMRASIAGGDAETVKAILAAHPDVNAKNSDGETALMYAVGGHPSVLHDKSKVNPDLEDVVGALLQAGADPAIVDAKARSALDLADTSKYRDARSLIKRALKK